MAFDASQGQASIFGDPSLVPPGQGVPSNRSAGVQPQKKPGQSLLDKVLSNAQQASQGRQAIQMGGTEYADYLDQMRMNQMATFY